MSKHTPGQWASNAIPNAPEEDFRSASAVWSEIPATDGGEPFQRLICSVHPECFYDWQPKEDERTANARLIAAAPELLEACKETLEILDDLKSNDGISLPALESMLNAAIAKATSCYTKSNG